MSTLSPEQWQEISPYLDQAFSLPENERAVWLASFKAEKPDLAELLQKLLDEHRALGAKRFLEDSPMAYMMTQSFRAGQSIGAYKLLSPIGQGGMGHVWLAERVDGRFERRVAVKFLRFSVSTTGGAERFQREGRILGRLASPNIAELLDAGVTSNGEPYLVLEYVEGEPIDEYCDRQALDVRTRIHLFLDILGAVAQANANLIVHRDIKPSNVLVRNDGQVKLLDFGIAKLLAEEATSNLPTLLTAEGGSALTPQFAAPEQVTGGAITTATDVYALGLLLYILLTGQHPAGPGPHSPAYLLKAITETDPRRPSDVVRALDEASAQKRGASREKLRRSFRGDLDLIVGKALKKNPQERYPSAAAFGDDLRRYLRHEPISVRPDTVPYRVNKYVRRHRVGVALATSFLVLLAGFSIVQAVELRRITRERDRADRIAEFMTGIFKVSDPNERVGATVTARELLDKAAKDIDAGLSKDPELQARMIQVMGTAYGDLGFYPRAQLLFERSIQIGRSALGPESRETLSTRYELSWVLFQQGHLAEAENLQREVLDAQRRVLGPEDSDTLRTMAQLANTLSEEGRLAEAEKMGREVLEKRKRVLGPEASETLASRINLSNYLSYEGKLDEAEKLDRETLEIRVRVFGFEDLGTIISMANLAEDERLLGRYEEAERLFRQTLDLGDRVLGPDQPETAETRHNLAGLLAQRGQTDVALSLLRQAIDHGLPPRVDLGIETDPMFNSLHRDPRFVALVAHAKEQAATQRAN